ncbi:hypothetical protein CAC42_6323 [Sphaceloma murrayae]|uniref:TauD/TfdA-like domain-containing protein n=1 Tax=Sphaceloma murrayae TaxID=2082308 RepID=A0A2K1QM34_9PEZI|nr:hypothetical protein CAC42_6323 [Sphaceloma murrayae]
MDRSSAGPGDGLLTPPEMSVSMDFHTDCDAGNVLAMFIQSMALVGGSQYVANFTAVYRDLLESYPEALTVLAEDWVWEKAHRPAPGRTVLRQFRRPIIAIENGRPQIHFARAFLLANNNHEDDVKASEPLSKTRPDALEALTRSANIHAVRLDQQVGDMVFINNFGVLHAREQFVDSPTDPARRRHILRLQLHDTEFGWPSAQTLKRSLQEQFAYAPSKHGLLTATEWMQLPRANRTYAYGVDGYESHD